MSRPLSSRESAPVFPAEDHFIRLVRQRVRATISGELRGDPRLHRKALVLAAWFLASYACALAAPNAVLFLAATLSWSLAACAVAFGVFHDANHGGFSLSPRVNLVVSRACCLALGVGRHFWCFKHLVLHHHGPNVSRWDDDVEARGWLRLSPHQPGHRRFRGQHFYFLPLYALNSTEWIFIKDFAQWATGRINEHRTIPSMAAGERLEFFACKLGYVLLFVIPPFVLQPPLLALGGFLLFHVVQSLILTLVFQVGHLNDKVAFAEAGTTADLTHSAHQLQTTSNFATDSRWTTWFTGGLNLQIEHHLFPAASHTHLSAIRLIVKEAAAETGLPYITHGSLSGAVASHARHLKALQASP
ncbi:MAG: acyl-CoA desaturase [Caulobacter sp.]|nr:acyl-CoA desaturase [Caulobacter sp.]